MGWLSNQKWKIKSVVKNLRKGKFKATFRYFWDTGYRRDINYMLDVVRNQDVKSVEAYVRVGEIQPCHGINYPDWVDHLIIQIKTFGYSSVDPIKVFYEASKKRYLVVDGNHRLSAVQKVFSKYQIIKVELLVPVSESKRESL